MTAVRHASMSVSDRIEESENFRTLAHLLRARSRTVATPVVPQLRLAQIPLRQRVHT